MLTSEILTRFQSLIERTAETDLREPAAVTLATVGENGVPSARVVLLRGYDERGFVFYTNTQSRKGRELASNSAVALCFYWDVLGEQVRIEGTAIPVDAAEADAYWRGRPRESQLGAWASLQSGELPERAVLEARLREFEAKFADQEVPRPDHWSGYRVQPIRIEFWSNRPARLHQRVVYEWDGEAWNSKLLYP